MQPWMMAGSFVPWMVIVTTCAVPSTVVTVKVSVRVSWAFSAWTAQVVLSSV